MRKICLIFVLIAAALVSVQAQNPVSLSMSVKPAKAKAGDKLTAQISASIGGGWHMYSITQGAGGPVPTKIIVTDGVVKSAGAARGSAPKREMDTNFGIMTEFYTGAASFTVPLAIDAAAQPGTTTIEIGVRYQVCNDTTCLPPKTIKVSAPIEIISGSSSATAANTAAAPTPTPSATPTATPTPKTSLIANTNVNGNLNQNTLANSVNSNTAANSNTETVAGVRESSNFPSDGENTLVSPSASSASKEPANLNPGIDKNQSIWSFIWLAMSVGALSLLTPCVFPMIPITVSYFTNHSSGNRASAIRNATIYALGIILTFTALGVALAVLFGAAGINQFASSPYVNLVITGIFVAFALSLFGAYNLQIPPNVMSRLDAYARGKESSHIIGLLLMGFVFSLTSFTCTAPFVGTLLVLAAQGEWLYPLIGMLAFSTVFALPFFVLALAPQLVSQLPKSGGWLNSVKVVMGLMEIAAAMKFLSNVDLIWRWGIFTREVVLASWVAIALLIGLYLLGKFQLMHDSPTQSIGAPRLLFAFATFALGFYLLTGLFGKPLGELESFLPPATETASAVNTLSGTQSANGAPAWITNDYEAALKKAKAENKPIFIDFTGYTCTNCRWMEANMFPKPEIIQEMSKYVLVRLYTDGEGQPFEGFQQMQQEKYNTVALPYYVILNSDGTPQKTFPGLTRSAGEFSAFLKN